MSPPPHPFVPTGHNCVGGRPAATWTLSSQNVLRPAWEMLLIAPRERQCSCACRRGAETSHASQCTSVSCMNLFRALRSRQLLACEGLLAFCWVQHRLGLSQSMCQHVHID
eukprot:355903-Chlamydomonas_euryale.AAC.13